MIRFSEDSSHRLRSATVLSVGKGRLHTAAIPLQNPSVECEE